MEYKPCGTSCINTCANPSASVGCTTACQEGCYCPEGDLKLKLIFIITTYAIILGLLLQDGQCIMVEECTCVDQGIGYDVMRLQILKFEI